MDRKILVTGASGLLGRALVETFLEEGFYVLGQYHNREPEQKKGFHRLFADFSTMAGIREFLETNKDALAGCRFLVNNYGPITYKDTSALTGTDFARDYHHNVVTAVEITRFLLEHAPLQGVVNLGFEFAGEIKAYRKVLAYAAAKNALLLVTESFARAYPDVAFHMVNPPTLTGAQFAAPGEKGLSPHTLARQIYQKLLP